MIALTLSLMCLVLSQDEDVCEFCTENQTCVDEYGYRQCYENCIESPARITGSGCACGGDITEACQVGSVCNEGKCLQADNGCPNYGGYNDSCHIKKTEAACESPCWWLGFCGCIAPRCAMYNTEETCTVASGKDCVWKEDRLCGNSIVGCCREVYCSDYGTEETCTGTVNGETCVWNPISKCVAASCYDYGTADTCKGTVNGEACAWLQEFYGTHFFYCGPASCYAYLTADDCKGTVGYDSCVWNPNFNNSGRARCERYRCNSEQHDSPTTCVSADVVGGYSCVWDSVRGFCTNEKSDSEKDNNEICHGADGDEALCKGKSEEYGCVWSDGKCNGKSEKDNSEICHGADGDEESCKGKSEEYGCVWSDGKCNGESSFALRIVSSTLLIALLLAFIL